MLYAQLHSMLRYTGRYGPFGVGWCMHATAAVSQALTAKQSHGVHEAGAVLMLQYSAGDGQFHSLT
jgi:hypothetical protein